MDDNLLWSVRAFVYQHLADTARPPSPMETAARFGLAEAEAAAVYAELHARHALFLDAATGAVRMANPFSGVPTGFRVHARGRSYWANCAWDALGIPAALHTAAEVEAACAQTGEAIAFSVPYPGAAATDESLSSLDMYAPRHHRPPGTRLRIHFLVPFRHWYDDLVFT
jgi:hypothetical protein